MRRLLSLIFLILPLMVSAQTAEVTLKGKVIDAADGYVTKMSWIDENENYAVEYRY